MNRNGQDTPATRKSAPSGRQWSAGQHKLLLRPEAGLTSSRPQMVGIVGSSKTTASSHRHEPFLEGTFAGGWQSNEDLPDRRDIVYRTSGWLILKIRPEHGSAMPQDLPLKAKTLEEYLYRSANTKQEYTDLSTLKKRLESVVRAINTHWSSTAGINKKNCGELDVIQEYASNGPGKNSVVMLLMNNNARASSAWRR